MSGMRITSIDRHNSSALHAFANNSLLTICDCIALFVCLDVSLSRLLRIFPASAAAAALTLFIYHPVMSIAASVIVVLYHSFIALIDTELYHGQGAEYGFDDHRQS